MYDHLARRDLLGLAVATLAPAKALTPDAAPVAISHRYGARGGRIPFRSYWQDTARNSFRHAGHPSFHRLQAGLDVLYSRCQQAIGALADRPVRLTVKLLCSGEAGRTLFTLGIKSRTHGCWAFSLGAFPTRDITFGTTTGWQIAVNAADPWIDRVSVDGYDHRDWHTFVLVVPGPAGPARLYCDGWHVLDLRQPITSEQRERIRLDQIRRHNSIQQMVPETPGPESCVFIESRHPGQIIDIDRFDLSQELATTARTSLAVLLDLDWELDGVRIAGNPLTRLEGNPVLRAKDIPDLSGQGYGTPFAYVLRDRGGFHMYLMGGYEMSKALGRNNCAVYHAVSPDGLRWQASPEPVLVPGGPGEWDEGSLGQACVLKEGNTFRMWYTGYTERLHQARTGYAESRDGVHWTKPKLGLFRFSGRETNIVYPPQPDLHSNEYEIPISIVRDDEGPPERRYVLFLHTQGPHGCIVDVATSPDGLRFTRAPHNARHYGFDPAPVKSSLHNGAVALHESGYWWAFVQHHEQQQPTMRSTGWLEEPREEENISFGLWRSRRPPLEPGAQAWEDARPDITSVLEVGSEWWAYYTSRRSVGLARVGRHRLYGLELLSEWREGAITSIGFRVPKGGWSGHRFAVNASGLGAGNVIRAALLDASSGRTLPGFGAEDSVPVEEDGYSTPLRWKTGYLPAGCTAAALRIHLKLARRAGNPQVHAVYLVDGRPPVRSRNS
ncbi:MAG: hypothetical protein AAB225_05655 [Acidobacteriota bacterium]